MHSSQARPRRQQDPPLDDDDVMSRLASRRGRDYDRGHAAYAEYSPHSARQPGFDTAASSSRRRSDWHPEPSRSTHDAYYPQEYHRPREEYETEAWAARPQGRYTSTNHEWVDPSYIKPSYGDAGWPAADAPPVQPTHGRQGVFNPRAHDDARGGWNDTRVPDRETATWRRDDTRDAGWASRTRPKEPVRPGATDTQTAEDRLWQPAASWQSNQARGDGGYGSRFQNGRNHPNHFNNANQKKSNKKKKNRFDKSHRIGDAGHDVNHVNK
jgi:hypothetical protein